MMDRDGGRAPRRHPWDTALALTILLLAGSVAVAAGDNPQPPPDPANQRIERLERLLEQVQQELAEARKERARARQEREEARKQLEAVKKAPRELRTRQDSKVEVSGYIQFRATNIGGSSGDRLHSGGVDFHLARVRPRIEYFADRNWRGRVEFDASTRGSGARALTPRDVYVEYRNAGYRATFGQKANPFGFQLGQESSRDRASLTRARMYTRGPFPSRRDVGFFLRTDPQNEGAVWYELAIVNGQGQNMSDVDAAKTVIGHVVIPLDEHNTLGASGYVGSLGRRSGAGAINRTSLHAYGVEHRLDSGRLHTQFEALFGSMGGSALNGALAQLLWDAGQPGSFFIRHDVFDPSKDAVGDYWQKTAFGWFKQFTDHVKITAEYAVIRNSLTGPGTDDTFGVQVQGNF